MNLNEQREFMRNNNLAMTLKLDRIIEDAKPKPKIEKRPIIPKRIIIDQDITGTPEYKANKQITDLLLSQTLNDTITNAMNLISGKKSENENKISKSVKIHIIICCFLTDHIVSETNCGKCNETKIDRFEVSPTFHWMVHGGCRTCNYYGPCKQNEHYPIHRRFPIIKTYFVK
jgi:hypothetical protein